jgi:hypothetical protein
VRPMQSSALCMQQLHFCQQQCWQQCQQLGPNQDHTCIHGSCSNSSIMQAGQLHKPCEHTKPSCRQTSSSPTHLSRITADRVLQALLTSLAARVAATDILRVAARVGIQTLLALLAAVRPTHICRRAAAATRQYTADLAALASDWIALFLAGAAYKC